MMKPVVVDALRQILKKNKKQKLLPVAVVNEARDPDSPLHRYFEWDDTKAAHAHRLDQARQLIASIEIISDDKSDPRPAFVSLASDRISGGYRDMNHVLSSAQLRKELLSTALGELKAMQARYDRMDDLVRVIKPAVRKVEKLAGK